MNRFIRTARQTIMAKTPPCVIMGILAVLQCQQLLAKSTFDHRSMKIEYMQRVGVHVHMHSIYMYMHVHMCNNLEGCCVQWSPP